MNVKRNCTLKKYILINYRYFYFNIGFLLVFKIETKNYKKKLQRNKKQNKNKKTI